MCLFETPLLDFVEVSNMPDLPMNACRLFVSRRFVAMSTNSFLVAYGSHTGQAESIARQIVERSELIGLAPRLFCLEESEKEFHLEKEPLAVIVISSTGDGDPPENAARFVRRISRKSLAENHLEALSYALLGLGDSNYSTYQGVPIKVDQSLRALGATPILERGAADDQVGLELVVEPWLDKLFSKLAEMFSLPADALAKLESSRVHIAPKKEDETVEEKMNEPVTVSAGDSPDVDAFIQHYAYPEGDSIKNGSAALSADAALRVPVAPQPFLLTAVSHKKPLLADMQHQWQNGAKMVGVASAPLSATVVGTALLTSGEARKPKRELVIEMGEEGGKIDYLPGDAFYFISPNPKHEVDYFLHRMGLLTLADQELDVSVDPKSPKLNASLPAWVPARSSLRHIFTHCLDIRRAPGRPILRVLADCEGASEEDKRRLLELCSAQGMADFTKHVRQAAVSMCDVLATFPSVTPKVERMIELLPRLIPRPYSVASASALSANRVRFVYSLLSFDVSEGRRYARGGLCSEWLKDLRVGDEVSVMFKEPARFRLPPAPLPSSAAASLPLLMVGPGTGVAVFLAMCQHILNEKLSHAEDFKQVERVLYFGCRNKDKDYIYRRELESYVREGVLSDVVVAESEGGEEKRYVQHEMERRADQVCALLSQPESRVFVCGDAKGMSKDVWAAMHSIIQKGMGLSEADAKDYMLNLKKMDRYIEDVWS